MGLLALALAVFRQRGSAVLVASFGGFALLYGVRLIFSSDLLSTVGVSGLDRVWVRSIVTYTIHVPAWLFFWHVLGIATRQVLTVWMALVGTFAVAGVVSDLARGTPGTLAGAPNNVLAILGILVGTGVLIARRRQAGLDQKVLALGIGVFGLFAVNENLKSMGVLPWAWGEETVGFLFFVGCLGFIAARRFLASEHQLVALESELETARRIQSSILPQGAPEVGGLSVAVRFRPTSAVAGDLYDFLDGGPEKLGLVVADVSGHGVPAALVASMVKVAFASRPESLARPARLLDAVNRTLTGHLERGFVTAAYVYLDLEQRRFVTASAGHPLPILRRCDGGDLEELGGQGTLLGRFPSATFREQDVALEPGDRLVIYTDGVVEALSPMGEMFGEKRLAALVQEGGGLSAEAFCDAVLEELRQWTGVHGELELEDDLTLLVVDVPGP